jgi:hypothetical protein
MPIDVDTPIEVLSRERPPDVGISREELDRIAALAVALNLEIQKREGILVSGLRDEVPYGARPDEVRAASRRTIKRVVEALMILGYIER